MKKAAFILIAVSCSLLQTAAAQSTPAGKKAAEILLYPPKIRAAKSPRAKVKAPDAKVTSGGETVESIFARNVMGQGGSYAMSKIKTQVLRGYVYHSMSREPGTCEYYYKSPEKMLMVINSPVGQFIEGYDGRQRWLQTPLGSLSVSSDRPGSVLDAGPAQGRSANSGIVYKVRGKTRVGEREADMVEVSSPGHQPQLLYYDSVSGLLLRSDSGLKTPAGAKINVTAYYDLYAEVDGVQVPVNVRFIFPEFTITAKIHEVKHNVTINDALFQSPKTTSAK